MALPPTASQARRSVTECLSSADQVLQQVQSARVQAEQQAAVRAAWLRVLALDIRDLVSERSVDCAHGPGLTDWETTGLLTTEATLEELAKQAHALAESQRTRTECLRTSAGTGPGAVESLAISRAELDSMLAQIELKLKVAQQERTRLVEQVESISAELVRCASLLHQARQVATRALREARKWRQKALAQDTKSDNV
jgi:hypothetical protein